MEKLFPEELREDIFQLSSELTALAVINFAVNASNSFMLRNFVHTPVNVSTHLLVDRIGNMTSSLVIPCIIFLSTYARAHFCRFSYCVKTEQRSVNWIPWKMPSVVVWGAHEVLEASGKSSVGKKANVKLNCLEITDLLFSHSYLFRCCDLRSAFVSDALHEKSFDVARRTHHKIWSVIAYRSERNNFGLLRRVDRWPEVPSGYGGLCGQREFSFVPTERQHAVQAWLRGGWLPEELITAESDWNRTNGNKLHWGMNWIRFMVIWEHSSVWKIVSEAFMFRRVEIRVVIFFVKLSFVEAF